MSESHKNTLTAIYERNGHMWFPVIIYCAEKNTGKVTGHVMLAAVV